MRVALDYGRGKLAVEVPDDRLAGVLEAPTPTHPRAPGNVLARALARPEETPPLVELARGRRSACVVVPDVTRPLPSRVVLPSLLKTLAEAGLGPERVLILIATGLHRPNEGAELEEMLGPEIVKGWRVENHVARDDAAHAPVGVTSTGVPVRVDRRYLAADLKILVGLVEPHFMAGYSGGRKLVCPGISAAGTIHAFHGPALIEHPRSRNCMLDGNPTHRTSTEAAVLAGVDFTLNVILDGDRRVVDACGGELDAAFLAATARARALTTAPVAAPVDVVLVSGGGYPLDATWYQAIKGLVAAMPAVRPGGIIVQAAALSEGIGSADFVRLMNETDDLEVFMRRLRGPGFFRNEQWELEEFALVARRAAVMLYSDGLPPDAQRKLFVTPVSDVQSGLAAALERGGPAAHVLVMPHGPYVLPIVAPTAGD